MNDGVNVHLTESEAFKACYATWRIAKDLEDTEAEMIGEDYRKVAEKINDAYQDALAGDDTQAGVGE